MTEIKTDFEIRQAEEEDVPEILELIKALAEFENLSDEVVATEELLKITLFWYKFSSRSANCLRQK